MKTARIVSLWLFTVCALGTLTQAQAQMAAPTYGDAPQGAAPQGPRYPEAPGTIPDSTLRMREIPGTPGMNANAPAPIHDTPESLEQYQRCQQNANRSTVTRVQLQAAITTCLNELAQRRQMR